MADALKGIEALGVGVLFYMIAMDGGDASDQSWFVLRFTVGGGGTTAPSTQQIER